MKRLAYLVILFTCISTSAQSFQVKNINSEYVVKTFLSYPAEKEKIEEVLKDNSGLYWFESVPNLSSFDGSNWKSYEITTTDGKTISTRFNDIEVTNDGTVWIATESGIFVLDNRTESFIPLKQRFPGNYEIPASSASICKGADNLVFLSLLKEGFYFFDQRYKILKHVYIDSNSKIYIPAGNRHYITSDKAGNFWGLTRDNNGIWFFNSMTGKVSCSWKGELAHFTAPRFKSRINAISYSEKENVLWISYGERGILEKKYLTSGNSIFYTFSDDLKVNADTSVAQKYELFAVLTDRDKNNWINVAGKYLVKLSSEITRFEYLKHDPDLLSLGEWNDGFFIESCSDQSRTQSNDNLLWVISKEQVSMLKKRTRLVRQIPFDTSTVKVNDYENRDGRKSIFFEKGNNNTYFLLQQNQPRPKLICFDSDLRIKKVLFNDKWKDLPAYFSTDFDPDTFYIAMMRNIAEPLDFRKVVEKDFKVHLNTFHVEELKLDFRQRIWRYGCADANNTYWLFSNGYLYSYHPQKNIFDSIYICDPAAKLPYMTELVKGFDYPTVLHKCSSTFWINFIGDKELYKIDLKTRKIKKIFKYCLDGKDCIIPVGIYDMYEFDSSRIYLQASLSSMLINVFTDSITHDADLFNNKLAIENPNSTGVYNNWIVFSQPSGIHFLNTLTGRQKQLKNNRDFKGILSQFNCKPLINDKGEMIVMASAQKEFFVFNIDSIPDPPKPDNVRLGFVKLNGEDLLMDSLKERGELTLKYNKYNSINFGFSNYDVYDQDRIIYEYTLYNGGDTSWNKIEGKPELTFTKISPGDYQLLIRAGNGFGDYSDQVTSFNISIIPPFTQTAWFIVLVIAAAGALLLLLYRYRLYQLNRLQVIRNNIASDLHDDIGSTLNSISIYSEVAKQQAGKEIPALDLIGANSRKIIENMSDIVWTINPENDTFEKIIIRMRSFAYQLLKAKKIEFTFEADEKLNSIVLPMQVRKNFYLVFKEAITNLIKYSGATRVLISLTEKNKTIVLKIRDNGKGIEISPETQGNGLLNMQRRAGEIKASLHIETRKDKGTGIEMELKI